MRLKLTYKRGGVLVEDRDLLITSDGSVTVGNIAEAIAQRDPVPGGMRAESLTLAHERGGAQVRLDPSLPIARTSVGSGATVSVVADDTRDSAVVDGRLYGQAVVLKGPDRGRQYDLLHRVSVIGRSAECDIDLSDPLVSKTHARVVIDGHVEVVDLGSSNGIEVGGGVVSSAVLRPTDSVLVGDTELRITRAASGDTAGPARVVDFVRSPRVERRFEGERFAAPRIPTQSDVGARISAATLLAPLLMGGVLFLVTGSAVSLLFIALSPVMSIASYFEQRSRSKQAFARDLLRFHHSLGTLRTDLSDSAQLEGQVRRAEQPTVQEVISAGSVRDSLLWTRRPEHSAFGTVLLGHGEQPSRSTVEFDRGFDLDTDLAAQIKAVVEQFTGVENVPIAVSLAEVGNVGVCGRRERGLALARGVLAHLVGLHSPQDLHVAAFVSSETWSRWQWLQWLPHSLAEPSPVAAHTIAAGESDALSLLSALEDLVDQRSATSATAAARLPLIVVVIDDDTPADHARLVQLGERGPATGVHLIWLAPDRRALPAICRAFIDGAGDEVTVGLVRDGQLIAATSPPELTDDEAAAFARVLSPVVDSGARVHAMADLPRRVPFLALSGLDAAADPSSVIDRWNETFSIYPSDGTHMTAREQAGSLRAVVGESELGPLALDLRSHGPHALVGGTTGAGKSEFLQSWILSLAATYSPQRVNFLFVDYKGGAAFGECDKLPHRVGLVTDLTEQLVKRALTSLDAEITYRETLLRDKGVKDVLDLERTGDPDCPPSLVIVIDEFAALVQEVPEFVDGVVGVAQRGRSLGLHLVMATQRPTGVIRDNLRANTNLRIALRMSDEGDSSDVVGTPLAAAFTAETPGRAIAKTGPGRVEMFQSAYAGGWTPPVDARADVVVEQLVNGVPASWADPAGRVTTSAGPTDVQRVVASVSQAAKVAGLPPPRPPWLEELPTVLELRDEDAGFDDRSLTFGLVDNPASQSQYAAEFRPEEHGNMAVFGTSGSGKSTLLRALALAAGRSTNEGHPCHVYAVSFVSQALAPLVGMPHIGAVIDGDDRDRVTRLIKWLEEVIDDRARRFSQAANSSTLSEYRLSAAGAEEPRLVLMIDGIGPFRDAYEAVSTQASWYQRLSAVAAVGRPYGVHIVVTADRPSALGSSLSAVVQRRVVMRMSSEEDLMVLGVPKGGLGMDAPAGRAWFHGTEMQVSVLGPDPTLAAQAVLFDALRDAPRPAGLTAAVPVQGMPEVVRLGDLASAPEDMLTIGVSVDDLSPVAVPSSGTIVIAGGPGSGRTTAAITVAAAAVKAVPDAKLILLSRGRSTAESALEWNEHAQSNEDVVLTLDKIERASSPGGGTRTIVVVEDMAKLIESAEVQSALEHLCRCASDEGILVAVVSEYEQLRGAYGLAGALKADGIALAMQPESYAASTIFDISFPALQRSEMPAGRAVLVRRGRAVTVQVAVAV